MSNNGQETNKKLNKMVWKLGNSQELQMLILVKEKEEKLSNAQNLCFLYKIDDLPYLMLLDIKIMCQT
jgi:hypothetical protein